MIIKKIVTVFQLVPFCHNVSLLVNLFGPQCNGRIDGHFSLYSHISLASNQWIQNILYIWIAKDYPLQAEQQVSSSVNHGGPTKLSWMLLNCVPVHNVQASSERWTQWNGTWAGKIFGIIIQNCQLAIWSSATKLPIFAALLYSVSSNCEYCMAPKIPVVLNAVLFKH